MKKKITAGNIELLSHLILPGNYFYTFSKYSEKYKVSLSSALLILFAEAERLVLMLVFFFKWKKMENNAVEQSYSLPFVEFNAKIS